MELSVILKGLIIGLSIAAPVGPIGILCIRRTLSQGRIAGLVSGLGAATADGFYGCIAGFGLTFISNLFIEHQITLRLIGGFFLCYLGIQTFRSSPSKEEAKIDGKNLWRAYISTLFLTLTNPLTILSFAAIFAGFGAGNTNGHYGLALILVLSVFSGSALWWFVLVTGIGFMNNKITPHRLRWINRISGVILSGFGLIALWSIRFSSGG
ncbi:LysE family translocator [Roseofilum reptotaenium CS-1145]|uniref:Lysine transporter LysE n=1 Tax=Roseofilum reptotaenium AO1-A TaxID=1925591 RepID=A0A1L9QRL7_9CYAN|nr:MULTISPECIES: LysE family translocator [Roseofilum]MBP0030767.1 LysE family translocator [Roseofilum sp. Guam]MDB9515444.1 LysE family translocator [Roseofilum reptotaenium CS-1145]OJJ25321.1 lysine transporter LysE [Roseofilum reptotaenium AO1-A]